MQKKIRVYHFHNGSGGGVLSVIQNLLLHQQHSEIENHVIYTINKDVVKDFAIHQLNGAATEQVFYYSSKWNFYHTCRKLAQLLPDENAVIVAHDWLELGMVSNLGLQNPVVFFLHGNYDYYFDLAKKHGEGIDKFICISTPIYNKLSKDFYNRKKDVNLLYFPVPEVKNIVKGNSILNVYYGVRSLTDERKQFHILPKIDSLLRALAVTVRWTIVGEGGDEYIVNRSLSSLQNVTYYPQLKNDEVLKLLCTQDLFVLPSYNEGLPLAVVEAMKAGVVPLITDWHGATKELVIEGESGFYVGMNDAAGYAAIIELLNKDREMLRNMSINASRLAKRYFDPYKNTSNIENVFIRVANTEKATKHAKKVYGSRLDGKYIPNHITTFFRRILK